MSGAPGRPKGLDGLCYGGDYNPEQWTEDVWREDVALMREAKVNLVTVGVFSWGRLEPEPGRYTFDWLDRVLDLLHEGGIKVCLATPTASPPPWFGLAHPDALTRTAEGTTLTHGSRDTYCVSAPAYREASRRIARAIAERYANHPALALWHVHNEYGTRCHCDHVAAAFRAWLRDRHGDLDTLNDAWTTAFWSQHYSAWEQIMPPRATQYLPNPAQALDFRRFLSDELLAHFREQKAILRELTPDVPVTTNFALGSWVPVNPWKWARELDLVAIDHYPSAPGPAAAEQTAFAADLARSWAGDRPWLLMEQAAGVVHTGTRMTAKRPGEITRHSLQHIARGSTGVMFFQWRASRGGAEQWHGGMVPHAGPGSRVFTEVRDLGRQLARLDVPSGRVAADAAIVWDPEAWWALETPGLPSTELDHLAAVHQAHRVLWRAGLTADFVAPTGDLSPYKTILIPSLYLIGDEPAARIARHVESGATLVVSFFSGVADEHGRARLGGHPGAFRDVLGVTADEFLPLAEPIPLSNGHTANLWSERLTLRGAIPLATYTTAPLTARAAITRNEHGSGRAFYTSTSLTDQAYADLLATAGLPTATPHPGIEVVRRTDAEATHLYAINHTETPHDLPMNGVNLLTGSPVTHHLHLPPGTHAIIRTH